MSTMMICTSLAIDNLKFQSYSHYGENRMSLNFIYRALKFKESVIDVNRYNTQKGYSPINAMYEIRIEQKRPYFFLHFSIWYL